MWPRADETDDLLRRVEQADPSAEERLWAQHREPLRRLIHLRLDHALGRRVDASDVVQDVMLKASQRLADYLRHPALPFHLWLRQIARDHMVDEHRRHRLAAKRSLDRERPLGASPFADRSSLDLAAALRDPGLTPAASALRAELQRRFAAALRELEEDDREILLMRHFEGLANAEAARVLGVSDAAAGMRHLRAVRRLRAVLGEDQSRAGIFP